MSKLIELNENSVFHSMYASTTVDETITFNKFIDKFYAKPESLYIRECVMITKGIDEDMLLDKICFGYTVDYLLLSCIEGSGRKMIRVDVTQEERDFYGEWLVVYTNDVVSFISLDFDSAPLMPEWMVA